MQESFLFWRNYLHKDYTFFNALFTLYSNFFVKIKEYKILEPNEQC